MMNTTSVFTLLTTVLVTALAFLGCQQSTGSSGDTKPPDQVTQLSANTGDGQLELRWKDPANNDLDHIAITWSPEDGEDQPKTVSAGTENATIFGLNNGTEYEVSVKTVDTAGNSSSSGASVSAPAADASALFSAASAGLTGVQNGSSSFGDVDGDGDLDLVITGSDGSTETAKLYEYSLGGYSAASAGLNVQDSSSSFGDVDGDGDLDLVITGSDGSTETATLYTNDGSGSFTYLAASAELNSVGDGSSSFGDVDGDGDLDLVITGNSGSSPTATLYTNDGSGSFTAASAGLTNVQDSSSSFGDVDGDGDLDLVIAGYNDPNYTATLYINDGNGSFTAASAGLTGVRYSSSSFGDVDGDGDLDLVITGQADNTETATLYENQLF